MNRVCTESARRVCDRLTIMAGNTKTSFVLASLVVVSCVYRSAQTDQILPEIDTYLTLSSRLRVNFQAKESREAGVPVQAEIGPSLNLYLKPLIKLRHITEFDVDPLKSRFLVLSIGYRYLSRANGALTTNRIEPAVTLNVPLKAGFLLSDRNRADLDWIGGNFLWRYRNRLQIQKTLTIRGYHPAPYASTEFFFQSQYNKWSNTAIYAGCLFPIGKHVQFNPYYEHQNFTGGRHNKQLNQLGLMLNLYFSIR